MKSYRSRSNGFTFLELLISLAIVAVIATTGVYAFLNARNSRELDSTVQTVAFKLNEARTNSLAGKAGTSYGVKFNSTSTVYFSGTSYNPADASNITYVLPIGITLTHTVTAPNAAIIFARLTGRPQASSTVTLTRTSNASSTQTIAIGVQGDISVIK